MLKLHQGCANKSFEIIRGRGEEGWEVYAVKNICDYIFFLPQLYLFLTFYSCQKPHPSCPCVKNDRKVKLFIGPTDFEVCLRMAFVLAQVVAISKALTVTAYCNKFIGYTVVLLR